jgi:hypothetical protein
MRAGPRIAILAILPLVSCKQSEEPPSVSQDETKTATTAAPSPNASPDAGTAEVARFGRGHLSGRVVFTGLPPSPERINMREDRKCRVLAEEDRIRPKFEVGEKRGLKGAVVWAEIDPALEYRPPAKPVELRIKKCRFHPEIIALQAGQKLLAINDDPFLHNVHAFTLLTEINVALPKKGDRQERAFRGADVDGTFKCELHPWEKGHLFVFSHPFFAVTDASGAFSIKNLPGPGPWRLFASHPRMGTKELSASSGSIEIQFEETVF